MASTATSFPAELLVIREMTSDGISGFELLIVSKDENIGTSERGEKIYVFSKGRSTHEDLFLYRMATDHHSLEPELLMEVGGMLWND